MYTYKYLLTDQSIIVFQISWIRRRDFHVLTSSMFTYTNDERFQVLHPEGSDDWTLQIKYVQDRDNGTYECQVTWTWHEQPCYELINSVHFNDFYFFPTFISRCTICSLGHFICRFNRSLFLFLIFSRNWRIDPIRIQADLRSIVPDRWSQRQQETRLCATTCKLVSLIRMYISIIRVMWRPSVIYVGYV